MELFRVEDAARKLSIKPGTLRRWIFDRKIQVVKIGTRAVRISDLEIERIIRDGMGGQSA